MSRKAASIALGAKAAEVAAAQKQVEATRAQVKALEQRIKDNAAKLKKAFASFGVTLPDNPSKDDLDLCFAYVESYNLRTEQIANQQVASLGFTPESERNRSAE
jgi:multidrug resistance efflux pump